MPHDELDKEIEAECQSIDWNDIWRSLSHEDPDLYISSVWENPFSQFLQNLVEDFSDIAKFEEWSEDGTPTYSVCIDAATKLAGGDPKLADFILRGYVALNEMPKEITWFGKDKERLEWVVANVEAYVEQLKVRNEELEASLKINKEAAP